MFFCFSITLVKKIPLKSRHLLTDRFWGRLLISSDRVEAVIGSDADAISRRFRCHLLFIRKTPLSATEKDGADPIEMVLDKNDRVNQWHAVKPYSIPHLFLGTRSRFLCVLVRIFKILRRGCRLQKELWFGFSML